MAPATHTAQGPKTGIKDVHIIKEDNLHQSHAISIFTEGHNTFYKSRRFPSCFRKLKYDVLKLTNFTL